MGWVRLWSLQMVSTEPGVSSWAWVALAGDINKAANGMLVLMSNERSPPTS